MTTTRKKSKRPAKWKKTPPPKHGPYTNDLAISKEFGIPYIDTSKKSCPSSDFPCGECGTITDTKLCKVGVSEKIPSGIQRLCEKCQNA